MTYPCNKSHSDLKVNLEIILFLGDVMHMYTQLCASIHVEQKHYDQSCFIWIAVSTLTFILLLWCSITIFAKHILSY